jgi:hypothetical protein
MEVPYMIEIDKAAETAIFEYVDTEQMLWRRQHKRSPILGLSILSFPLQ